MPGRLFFRLDKHINLSEIINVMESLPGRCLGTRSLPVAGGEPISEKDGSKSNQNGWDPTELLHLHAVSNNRDRITLNRPESLAESSQFAISSMATMEVSRIGTRNNSQIDFRG